MVSGKRFGAWFNARDLIRNIKVADFAAAQHPQKRGGTAAQTSARILHGRQGSNG
jgi:hypothetical protein